VADPPIIRWGIVGTGAAARVFARDLRHLPDARLVAVGSRTDERAQAFGRDLGVPKRYGRYADLVQDPEVDVVYIATPASAHHDNMLLCLSARKPVLCEKPFTVDVAQAREVVSAARRAGVFVMEAMWTRFLPAIDKLRGLLADGAIGDVRYLVADLGSPVGPEPEARLARKDLGGGALLQKGVYLVSLASMLFGRPSRVMALGNWMSTGVDDDAAVLLGHEGGQLAFLLSSFAARTSREAIITGSRGRIRMHPPINCPARLTVSRGPVRHRSIGLHPGDAGGLKSRLVRYGKSNMVVRRLRERYWTLGEWLVHGERTTVMPAPFTGDGVRYQAAEVMRCLRSGRTESDVMPLDESVTIMETIGRIQEQLGSP